MLSTLVYVAIICIEKILMHHLTFFSFPILVLFRSYSRKHCVGLKLQLLLAIQIAARGAVHFLWQNTLVSIFIGLWQEMVVWTSCFACFIVHSCFVRGSPILNFGSCNRRTRKIDTLLTVDKATLHSPSLVWVVSYGKRNGEPLKTSSLNFNSLHEWCFNFINFWYKTTLIFHMIRFLWMKDFVFRFFILT